MVCLSFLQHPCGSCSNTDTPRPQVLRAEINQVDVRHQRSLSSLNGVAPLAGQASLLEWAAVGEQHHSSRQGRCRLRASAEEGIPGSWGPRATAAP